MGLFTILVKHNEAKLASRLHNANKTQLGFYHKMAWGFSDLGYGQALYMELIKTEWPAV
jgi:hypothetical protein